MSLRRAAVVSGGVGLAYAGGSLLSFHLFGASDIGVAYFPAAGVSAAALVLLPRRDWVWALLAVVVAEVAVDMSQGYAFGESAGFALANSVEPLVGASLLLHWCPEVDLRRRRDLALFTVTMLAVGPLVGATIGATTFAVTGASSFATDLSNWWVGDGLAVLTLGVPIIVLARREARRDLLPWAETIALLAVCLGLSLVVFWRWEQPFVFILGPVLVASAFRFGVAGVAVSGAVIAIVANVATATGTGPFAAMDELTAQEQLGVTQLFLAVLVLTSLFFAVEIHERDLVARQRRQERAGRRRAELLAAVATALERDVAAEERAQAVVDLLVPGLADYATVERLDAGGATVMGLRHVDPERAEVLRALREDHRLPDEHPRSVVSVLAEGETSRTGPITTEVLRDLAPGEDTRLLLEHLDPGHHLTVPFTRSVTTGAVLVGRSAAARPAFDIDEAELIEEIAWRTGVALENARLYAQARDVALRLQRSLLGDALIESWDVTCAGWYAPGVAGLEVGGDWYDTVALPGGRVGAAVGDVVGRGVDAAATMGRLRTALTALAGEGDPPGLVLERFDRFARRVAGADCASCVYATVDPHTGDLSYAAAGHPPPLLVRADGMSTFLENGRSALLGLQDTARATGSTRLEPGDLLLLYSDGLVERSGEVLDEGLARLAGAVVARLDQDPAELCESVVEALTAGAGRDDTVLLVLRLDAQASGTRWRRFPAVAGELAAARRVLRCWLAELGVGPEHADAVVAAAGEAMANAVEHAYLGDRGEVDLRVEADGPELVVTVRDDGHWRTWAPTQDRGRGTTVMEHLAHGFERVSDARGTLVRLAYRLDRPAP